MTESRADDPVADQRARVAIDLGAESCRVSLLRWREGAPVIELIHRIPNGPVHAGASLRWPFEHILNGVEEGLRKAAVIVPEGIASIAVDGWAVDYVRLNHNGEMLEAPFCYRDERTLKSKEAADRLVGNEWMFQHTGAQPLRINTVYQLLADPDCGIDPHAPWMNLPEYVLYRLGGRRVAEYTNATHSGLVDLETGDWSLPLLKSLDIPADALPPIVPPGTIVGKVSGPLAQLPAFRDTDLIAPACHDTASAIAGITSPMDATAYICSGTWSLVGTLVSRSITTTEAMDAGFTNQGAASGGFCFHSNVNGMWLLKQCMESWRRAGRAWEISELIARAAERSDIPGTVPVDAAPLMLDGDMPNLINQQLRAVGANIIQDCAGNEPLFARVIFESLARRYAAALRGLEQILGRALDRVHILGGGSQNALLTRLTAEYTALPVTTGHVESSTIGNFALQLAAHEGNGGGVKQASVRQWAQVLCDPDKSAPSTLIR